MFNACKGKIVKVYTIDTKGERSGPWKYCEEAVKSDEYNGIQVVEVIDGGE